MTTVTLPTSTVANSSGGRMHCFPLTQITQNSIDLRSVWYNLCIWLHIYVVDNVEKMKWLKLTDFIPWAGDNILTEPMNALSKNTNMRLLLNGTNILYKSIIDGSGCLMGFIFRCYSDKPMLDTNYTTLADACIWCQFLLAKYNLFIHNFLGLLLNSLCVRDPYLW